MFRLILTIAVSLALAHGSPTQGKGPSPISSRIINGWKTKIENYPYQVGLQYFNSDSMEYGTGAIISPYWVVTAGKLVGDENFLPSQIRVGGTSKKEGSIHEIDYIVLHENYTSAGDDYLSKNDIALIKVKTPFVFNEKCQPIKISESRIPVGAWAHVSGWGISARGNTELSDVLLATLTFVDTQESCNKTFKDIGYFQGVSDTYVCAYGALSMGPNYGDEGAPLWYDGQLHGIASTFHKTNSEVVYTDISQYRDWIRAKTGV